MSDNRERAIAELAEEIGWTTGEISYCSGNTYSVIGVAVAKVEQKLDLLDALKAEKFWIDAMLWNRGQKTTGFAFAKAPDWLLKQHRDSIDAAIAKAERGKI